MTAVAVHGTPQEIAANKASHAGQYLRQVLQRRPSSTRRSAETQAAE